MGLCLKTNFMYRPSLSPISNTPGAVLLLFQLRQGLLQSASRQPLLHPVVSEFREIMGQVWPAELFAYLENLSIFLPRLCHYLLGNLNIMFPIQAVRR